MKRRSWFSHIHLCLSDLCPDLLPIQLGLCPAPCRILPDQNVTPTHDTARSPLTVDFDLFNEPYPDSNQDTTAAWRCWRDGGACAGVPFKAAGMQELVQAIRGRGARNVIMLGGVQYANALSHWLTYQPADTAHNLAAAWHAYDFNACNTVTCWESTIAPIAQRVPVVVGEFGEKTHGVRFVTTLLTWLDRLPQGASYLAWTWDAWKSWDALIIDYNGTPNPTTYGITYYDYLTGGAIVGRQLQICRLELCGALLV